jgi:hypothetical protein
MLDFFKINWPTMLEVLEIMLLPNVHGHFIVMYSHSLNLQCVVPNIFIVFKFFDVFILDKI